MVRSASGDVMVDLTTIRDQDGRAVPIVDLPPELAGVNDLAVWREVIETASARARVADGVVDGLARNRVVRVHPKGSKLLTFRWRR